MEKRPSIPESIKRQIRQEAKFGCIFCGSPIVEYHHIEPYCKVKCHEKENLALLCPEHHHRANCGELLKEKVIEAKNNPFNVRVNFVRKEFCEEIEDCGKCPFYRWYTCPNQIFEEKE